MMIPVRCWTCGKVVANKWEPYKQLIHEQHLSETAALDRLKVLRYCCRRMLLSHVDQSDELIDSQVNRQKHQQSRATN